MKNIVRTIMKLVAGFFNIPTNVNLMAAGTISFVNRLLVTLWTTTCDDVTHIRGNHIYLCCFRLMDLGSRFISFLLPDKRYHKKYLLQSGIPFRNPKPE